MIDKGLVSFSPLLVDLIQALRCLPGVGNKTAQRMAFNLLERQRDAGQKLAHILLEALEKIRHCEACRNFSDTPICTLCQDSKRDKQTLCVVETPADVLAIEQSGGYRGQYFLLLGRLSPLDGIGPQALGLDLLLERCQHPSLQEVILATNLTIEGEATAHYISNLLNSLPIKISRIAYGVPLGGELEYVDGGTLARALSARSLLANKGYSDNENS
jgi:recombination protein RecR